MQKPKITSKFLGGIKNQVGGSRDSIILADNKTPIFKKSNHLPLQGLTNLKASKGHHVYEKIINRDIF
jgi:hypothetical protein